MIPNAEDLLALEPEELAPILLQVICSSGEGMSPGRAIKPGNLFMPGSSPVNVYLRAARKKEPGVVLECGQDFAGSCDNLKAVLGGRGWLLLVCVPLRLGQISQRGESGALGDQNPQR